MRTREEMIEFQKQREELARRERAEVEAENRRLMQHAAEQEEKDRQRKLAQQRKAAEHGALAEKLGQDIIAKKAEREELERIQLVGDHDLRASG